jgi:hypothetical protein
MTSKLARRAPGGPGHCAAVDTRRQGRSGHGVFDLQPSVVHARCELCNRGLLKSYSLNSIGHSFNQSAGRRSGADLSASVRHLVLCNRTDAIHLPTMQ